MDVWRITVVALRRWYVLLPLLALTVFLTLAVGRGVKAEYDIVGVTMMVPGRVMAEVPNPYGGLSDANNAVAIVLNSPESRAKIADQGLISDYEVTAQSRSTVMNFQVRGDTPEEAVNTGIALFQMAATELRDRQTAAGISKGAQYTIDVLQEPMTSEAVTDGKLRNMAVVGVLGAALSLVVAVLFDDIVGLVRRRRPRKRDDQTPVDDDQTPVEEHQTPVEDDTLDAGVTTTVPSAPSRPVKGRKGRGRAAAKPEARDTAASDAR